MLLVCRDWQVVWAAMTWNGVSNSHISQINESGLELTTDDQSLLETLETLCGSASTSSKLVDSRIKENFVSIYVFKLS